MANLVPNKMGLRLDTAIQTYYGKFGGFFVPDPFTPALHALAEDFAKAAGGPDLPAALAEVLRLMGLASLSLKPAQEWGKTKCHPVPSRVQGFLIAGYAALGKVLGRRLACGVHSRHVARAFAELAKAWGLSASLWLDRELGNDAALAKGLHGTGLEVDLEKTRTLFDDPTMYAFQRYISDPNANLFVPLATNVGPYPFPGISAAFAALYGEAVHAAVEAASTLRPVGYAAPGIPGTEMVAILRTVKEKTRLITYETPWETEREDCYCGAYTKVVQKGSREQVLSPELVAAWEAGMVQRIQAADARAAIQGLDLSGDVILIEEP